MNHAEMFTIFAHAPMMKCLAMCQWEHRSPFPSVKSSVSKWTQMDQNGPKMVTQMDPNGDSSGKQL